MGAPKGNNNAVGNNGGAPPKFNNNEDLQAKIDEYFETCKPIIEDGVIVDYGVPTITGLALHLGFASRQSIYDYKENVMFSYTIKRAITRVENGYEKRLSHAGATGAIFALKNMGWSDTQNVDHTSSDGSMKQPARIEFVRTTKKKNED